MKRNNIFLVFHLLALSLSFFSCDAQHLNKKITPENVRKAINESHRNYFQAFIKGDSSLLTALYTEDCWIMPPNASTLSGIDAPLDFFRKAYYKQGVRDVRFITTALYGGTEKFITETGLFRFIDRKKKVSENGTFITLWKNTESGWKMFRNAFSRNSNQKD